MNEKKKNIVDKKGKRKSDNIIMKNRRKDEKWEK